eukprot:CAMPEP_0172768920 /NCGR_PEP_ID=MMETSP1074-20121228/185644_1 /TAXON_ID=2916 /ORGANISM="Ceratium fusus, Strain PA161109" /LENGTH=65 /DNA_ID=CAMNT_0013604397 /DNA_START=13 /DNA_END=207 /DNA_ORIENTATION=+
MPLAAKLCKASIAHKADHAHVFQESVLLTNTAGRQQECSFCRHCSNKGSQGRFKQSCRIVVLKPP